MTQDIENGGPFGLPPVEVAGRGGLGESNLSSSSQSNGSAHDSRWLSSANVSNNQWLIIGWWRCC